MVELDQFRYRISGYDKPMAQIKKSLDLDNKQKRIEELEADMEAPGFWDNPDKSQNAMKELKGLKDAFERYNECEFAKCNFRSDRSREVKFPQR